MQVFFNHFLHLAIGWVGLITKEKERNVRFFVYAWEKVDGIIRSSSGGVLELEDSDDDSTNGEGHTQGPEH